jgi:hypothetical protein
LLPSPGPRIISSETLISQAPRPFGIFFDGGQVAMLDVTGEPAEPAAAAARTRMK